MLNMCSEIWNINCYCNLPIVHTLRFSSMHYHQCKVFANTLLLFLLLLCWWLCRCVPLKARLRTTMSGISRGINLWTTRAVSLFSPSRNCCRACSSWNSVSSSCGTPLLPSRVCVCVCGSVSCGAAAVCVSHCMMPMCWCFYIYVCVSVNVGSIAVAGRRRQVPSPFDVFVRPKNTEMCLQTSASVTPARFATKFA